MPRDDNERRSPTPHAGGLPIFSTEKITAAEDAALGELARTYRLVADRIDEVRRGPGTVSRALEIANLAERLGQTAGEIAVTLGTNR